LPLQFKILVIGALLLIVFSLGSGLVFLVRDKSESTRMVKALTVRISLSVVLFGLLLLGRATGFFGPG
jgi:hypothetical protein